MASREKTIKALKKSLKQAHPKWSEEKIVSTALAIYNSKSKKDSASKIGKKEYSAIEGIDWKENLDLGTFYSKGYAATTEYDRVGDIFTLDCLEDAAEQINSLTHIDSDEVSYRHDRSDPKPMGIAEKNALVVEKEEDVYALQVTTNHVKTHEKYDEYVYDVKNNVVKGYSVEYIPTNVLEDTRVFDESGNVIDGHRVIDKMMMRGYGYASGRFIANPGARLIEYGYKEIQTKIVENKVEEKTMSEEIIAPEKVDVPSVETPKEEPVVEEVKEATPALVTEPNTDVHVENILNKEAIKTPELKEQVVVIVKELLKDEIIKKEIEELDVKEKVMIKEEEKMEEKIEIKELKNLFADKTIDLDVKFKEAGIIAEKLGLVSVNSLGDGLVFKQGTEAKPGMQFKQFRTNGNKLEYKGLSITTNQNTDTDYLLSGAELRDVFDPMIWDALNQSTTTWGLLKKDDFSNKGNNQVQFILETGTNSTAGFYTGNSVSTGQSTILKMQTKFKKVQVGVSVDGDMIAAARGGPVGDVFGLHVRLATKTLLNTINAALFDEVGLETAAAVIGFEYLADSAGNTTLYNLTRSTTNRLAPDAAGDTYINGASAKITPALMRQAMEQAIKEGADINNLVWITHPTQERLFKGIYDASQRLMPTSSRFGFTGRPEFDSVPIFADKDCTSDNWHLVDLETHRIAIWVPPTLEMLGKSADSVEGFIKCYLAVYNTMPRRVAMIYDCATS